MIAVAPFNFKALVGVEVRLEIGERGKWVARHHLGYGRGERRNVGKIGIRNQRRITASCMQLERSKG